MNKCFLFLLKSFFLLVLLAGTQTITVKMLTDISKSKDNQAILLTATGLEPRTTYFLNEHSTIWPNWPNYRAVFWELICSVLLTVCSCHVTYAFQSESTLYSCLNVKELLARSRREIWRWSDCNWTGTQNHLVLKRTLNHFTVKSTVQISTQNTARSFGQFGQIVECSFKN